MWITFLHILKIITITWNLKNNAQWLQKMSLNSFSVLLGQCDCCSKMKSCKSCEIEWRMNFNPQSDLICLTISTWNLHQTDLNPISILPFTSFHLRKHVFFVDGTLYLHTHHIKWTHMNMTTFVHQHLLPAAKLDVIGATIHCLTPSTGCTTSHHKKCTQ